MTHGLFHFILNIGIISANFGIVFNFLYIITYNYSKFDILNHIFINWDKNLINKIIFSINPINYLEPLFIYKFPYINNGCYCPDNQIIYKELCSSDKIKKNCENINKYENSSHSNIYFNNIKYYIYIERDDIINYNYYIEEKRIKNFCDKTEIDCGIIDTLENHLCLEKHKKCPHIKKEYENINKNNKIESLIDNIINNTFNIEFILSTNDICINYEESSQYNGVNYILFDNYNILLDNNDCQTFLFNNIYYDNRFDEIFQTNISNILSPNLKNILNDLPLFDSEFLLSSDIFLYSRKYIGLNTNCQKFINLIKNLNFKKNNIIFFTICLIMTLIVIPYYLILIMIIMQLDSRNYKLNYILNLILFMIIIIFGTFIIFKYNKIIYYENLFNIISNEFCGDDITNNLFYSIYQNIIEIKIQIIYSIYWIVIQIFFSLIKMCLIWSKKNKFLIYHSLVYGNLNDNIISIIEINFI